MKSLVLLLLMASVALTGCVIWEEQTEVPQNETPAPPPPPPNPVVSISSPSDGDVIMIAEETTDVTILMNTQNLVLRPSGGSKKIGEGHFKVTLNGESEDVATKVYVISGLGPGDYSVEVELLHNDGTSYTPRIVKTVDFTIEMEEPEEYVPQEYTVELKDFEYDPDDLTVMVSDEVTFVNKGSFPRSATCFIDGVQIFDTGVLGSGASKTITMQKPVECEYYSTTYKLMTGNIKVEPLEG